MAKYDDFGRPIYETAEEYNKAHKGGVCPRTYDSPEGDNYRDNSKKNIYQTVASRYANRTASKKMSSVVVVLAALVIFFNIGIIFTIVRSVSGSYGEIEFEDNLIDECETEEYFENVEYLGGGVDALPEGFDVFSYNGQTCVFPTTLEEIIDMGLYLENYTEDELIPYEWEEFVNLYDESESVFVTVRVNNYETEDLPIGECLVDYIYIDNPAAYNDYYDMPDFEFGDGLNFESRYEDFEAYLGTPYYHYENYEDDYIDVYDWAYFGEDETQYVSVTFWNGYISSIAIERKEIEVK